MTAKKGNNVKESKVGEKKRSDRKRNEKGVAKSEMGKKMTPSETKR